MSEVFDLAIGYEKGTWEKFVAAASNLHVPKEIGPDLYMQSVDWARGVLAGHDVTNAPAR